MRNTGQGQKLLLRSYPVASAALRRQLGGQDVVLVVVQVRGFAVAAAVLVVAHVEPVLVVPPPAVAGRRGDVCGRRRARRGVPHAWNISTFELLWLRY